MLSAARAAVRGVLRVAWRLEQMTAEDFRAAVAVKSIKGGQEEPAGRALAAGEILALLDTCLADVSPTEENGERWGKLTVRGRGNKTRNLPVAGDERTSAHQCAPVSRGAVWYAIKIVQKGGAGGAGGAGGSISA